MPKYEMHRERRETLKIIGAIGIQCAFPFAGDELFGQHVHIALANQANPGPPQHFRGEDYEMLARVAELIVPGARKAQVPEYIDLVVRSNADHQKTFAAGLAWLKERQFLSLNAAGQLALLEPLCAQVDKGATKTAEQRFFRAAKSMTADGFWTSRVGLMEELGYQGNQVLAEFPECKIDEH